MGSILKILEFLNFITTTVETLNKLSELAERMNYGGKDPVKNMKSFLRKKDILKILPVSKVRVNKLNFYEAIKNDLKNNFPEDLDIKFIDEDSFKIYLNNMKKPRRKKIIIEKSISKYLNEIINDNKG